VPESIASMHSTGCAPSIQQLLACLGEILDLFEEIYVVIDAVDESKVPRTGLLGVLQTLAVDPRFKKIQLLATSREYFDIESVLSNISMSVSMERAKVEKDIRTYVHSTLRSNRRIAKWPDALRDEVENALAIGAKGMQVNPFNTNRHRG
jgi:hypothetical protein